jgi:hypothetical protein
MAADDSDSTAGPPSGTERRLGQRLPANGIPVTWIVEERRWGRTKLRAEPGRLIELSVAGGKVVAPRSAHVRVGTPVVIRLTAGRAVVDVRHIGAGPDPARAAYGVNFVEVDDAFQTAIFDMVAEHRGAEIEWRWDPDR